MARKAKRKSVEIVRAWGQQEPGCFGALKPEAHYEQVHGLFPVPVVIIRESDWEEIEKKLSRIAISVRSGDVPRWAQKAITKAILKEVADG